MSEKRLVSTRRDRERIRQPAHFIQILADSVVHFGGRSLPLSKVKPCVKQVRAIREQKASGFIRRKNSLRPTDERRQPYKASDATNEVGHGRAEWLGLELSDNPKTKEKSPRFFYETRDFLMHFTFGI